ncbi:MAG: hypothetical protein QNK24_08225 [Desulfuromusa sp.]|nr:hypothetical protein [Desulfuromusa sp.]
MKITNENIELTVLHDKSNYQISDLDSEVYVDRLCSSLLKKFHQYLLQECRIEPLAAGSLAAGADYFLREFMIDKKRENIFDATAQRVEQFAGNWYIISTLEPNVTELGAMLEGTANFYQYCALNKLTNEETATHIRQICNKIDYFQQRIEDFHDISGDGYSSWDKACPL